MYPELFRIGDFVVTSFGLFVGLGAAVGLWVLHRELMRRHLPANALDGAIIGVLAGLAGAKLLYVAEHVGQEPLLALLLDRGGMSWFGRVLRWRGIGSLVFSETWASHSADPRRVDACAGHRTSPWTHRVFSRWRRLRSSKQPAMGDRVSAWTSADH
jgi:prolipoprotein diacylglyceryltransferase